MSEGYTPMSDKAMEKYCECGHSQDQHDGGYGGCYAGSESCDCRQFDDAQIFISAEPITTSEVAAYVATGGDMEHTRDVLSAEPAQPEPVSRRKYRTFAEVLVERRKNPEVAEAMDAQPEPGIDWNHDEAVVRACWPICEARRDRGNVTIWARDLSSEFIPLGGGGANVPYAYKYARQHPTVQAYERASANRPSAEPKVHGFEAWWAEEAKKLTSDPEFWMLPILKRMTQYAWNAALRGKG